MCLTFAHHPPYILNSGNYLKLRTVQIVHNKLCTGENHEKCIISDPCQFQACNKSQYCLGPSVTGPHRKRCLNIYHGLHCIRTDQWKGISILTMVNIEIRTSRTMQGRINKEMKFNISHGWYWNRSTWNSGWTRTWIPILSMVDIEIRASRTLQESKISSRIHPWQKALPPHRIWRAQGTASNTYRYLQA